MNSIDETVVDKPNKRLKTCETKEKRLPPLVLPDSDFDSDVFKIRLMYFNATINAFKWDQTNINSKTKKFLARNGFHCLVWSAILTDKSFESLVMDLFSNNLKLISDEEFESTFGIPLDMSEVTPPLSGQLLANSFLLFALPAKSHTKYLHEWTKRRLNAFYASTHSQERPDFDPHLELFDETKRRFYVYKDLVPKLTEYVIQSFDNSMGSMKEFLRQIKIAISYSGLLIFNLSYVYQNGQHYQVFELQELKDDVKRITDARNTIVEKYGKDMLPFARLMNYPEVELLDRRHYPDLAFCAYYNAIKGNPDLWSNFVFGNVKTKVSKDVLKRSAMKMVFTNCSTSWSDFGFESMTDFLTTILSNR